jgi:hypothetical protein
MEIEKTEDNNNEINNKINNEINNEINDTKTNDNYTNSNVINIYDNFFDNQIIYENETCFTNIYTKLKNEINIEFSTYIIKNCKYLISYDNKKIIFSLQRIGNIKNILNNLQNINKRIFNNLEYKIHKEKMFMILDRFRFLMMNKGYYFDFNKYNYILYDFKNNKNTENQNTNNKEEIYFIKMKSIIVNTHNNNSEGKTYIMFIYHNEKLLYYLY